jgi:hypothetical protein
MTVNIFFSDHINQISSRSQHAAVTERIGWQKFAFKFI